jgi:branched-chain amino acid transport system permease protein
MIYREAGRLRTSYLEDRAIFRLPEDRVLFLALMTVAVLLPLFAGSYLLGSILTPFLVLSLAAVGLNVVTGFAGQISLGSAGFMAVGAFTVYALQMRAPWLGVPLAFLLAGTFAALIGAAVGLCSARIRGFYVAVATLAAQFMLEWLFTHVRWFTLGDVSGVVTTRSLSIAGFALDTAARKYLFTLAVVGGLAWIAKNLTRSAVGRSWTAVRDMEVAAASMGIRPLAAKLTAFAVSSFYCAVAGALWAFVYLGAVDPEAFTLHRSFNVLFMIIIGGLGSIMGSFLGAAFISIIPIALANASALVGQKMQADTLANLELMTFGGLIVLFLILEPHGLARLVALAKEKLRAWPHPY